MQKLILPIGLAALGYMLLGQKSANAAPATTTTTTTKGPGGTVVTTTKTPSAVMLTTIAQTVASADPVKMRALAKELEQQGFSEQAVMLRAAADAVEQAIKTTPGAPPPPAKTSPGNPTNPAQPAAPYVPAPSVPSVVVPFPVTGAASKNDEARVVAGRVALEITTKAKGRENRELVKQYQRQEAARQHYDGAIDGLYGAKTALSLAHDFGIVPPKPMYWPTNPVPVKKLYSAEMLRYAAQDGARREEWERASKV